MTVQNIINDIQSLRGAEVKVFGQPTTLSSEVDDFYIDVIEVLNKLKEYEVTEYEKESYDEEAEEYEYETVDLDNIDDYIQHLEDIGNLTELKADNSYNWSSPVSNDFNFQTYRNDSTGEYLVVFKVHRYGDVRGNYTDECLLSFQDDYIFFETLTECNKSIDIEGYEGYYANVDILSDSMEIYDNEGNYVGTGYDMDSIVDAIKEHEEIEQEE